MQVVVFLIYFQVSCWYEIIDEIAGNEGEPGDFKFFSTDKLKKRETLSSSKLRQRPEVLLGLNTKG